MTASFFTLQANGRTARFTAPDELLDDRRRMAAQAETAIGLLRALNEAVSGYPVGPFRELYIFNPERAHHGA